MSHDPRDLENSKQWRMRAEEMRSVAEGMTDPTNRATAFRLAKDYDRLAEHAQRHQQDRMTLPGKSLGGLTPTEPESGGGCV